MQHYPSAVCTVTSVCLIIGEYFETAEYIELVLKCHMPELH